MDINLPVAPDVFIQENSKDHPLVVWFPKVIHKATYMYAWILQDLIHAIIFNYLLFFFQFTYIVYASLCTCIYVDNGSSTHVDLGMTSRYLCDHNNINRDIYIYGNLNWTWRDFFRE